MCLMAIWSYSPPHEVEMGTIHPICKVGDRYVAGDITAHSVDCTHHEMLTTGSLSMYGEQLKLALEA